MIGNKFKYYAPFMWVAIIIVIGLACFSKNNTMDAPVDYGVRKERVVKVEFKDTKFDTIKFKKELGILGIHHVNIVYAQAKLETGNFTSNLFLKNNNLFGFRGKNGYIKYNNWKESCLAYKLWQQKRYNSGEYYYRFLKDIKYAEDSDYINKLKKCLN